MTQYYDKHVFFCTNQRDGGAPCCNAHGAREARDYMKDKTKLDFDGRGERIRVNSAGCLGRCEVGPVIVVYPEGVWYTYEDRRDLDEIIEQHLKHGRIVERLKV